MWKYLAPQQLKRVGFLPYLFHKRKTHQILYLSSWSYQIRGFSLQRTFKGRTPNAHFVHLACTGAVIRGCSIFLRSNKSALTAVLRNYQEKEMIQTSLWHSLEFLVINAISKKAFCWQWVAAQHLLKNSRQWLQTHSLPEGFSSGHCLPSFT